MIQQNKPHYPWDKEVVCAMEDGMWCVYKAFCKDSPDFVLPLTQPPSQRSCPAYCCDIVNTVSGLQQHMNMTFRKAQVRVGRAFESTTSATDRPIQRHRPSL